MTASTHERIRIYFVHSSALNPLNLGGGQSQGSLSKLNISPPFRGVGDVSGQGILSELYGKLFFYGSYKIIFLLQIN